MYNLTDKYVELYKKYKELEKLQCVYGNQDLEKIASEDEVKELNKLGLYNPKNPFPKGSSENVLDVQMQMYETVCKMKVVYEILQESFLLTSPIEKLNRKTDEVYHKLKEHISVSAKKNPFKMKNSDIQRDIFEIFR